jgi:hypothetical protein
MFFGFFESNFGYFSLLVGSCCHWGNDWKPICSHPTKQKKKKKLKNLLIDWASKGSK